MEYTVCTL